MNYVLVHHKIKDCSKLISNMLLLIIIFNSASLQATDNRKALFLKNTTDGLKPGLSSVRSPSEKESLNQTFADGIIYSENFDSGAPGWTIKDFWSESSWHLSPTGSLSGNSYWCGIEELGGYDDQWQHTMISPSILLPSSSNLSLTFWHSYKIEDTIGTGSDIPDGYDAWDAVTVQISTDGVTFVPLIPEDGYKATNASAFYFYYGHGLPGWFGSSSGWVQAVFDLNVYAGQTIWIRLELGSDTGFSSAEDNSMFGWRVDDIEIKDGTTTIFFDDAGDTGPAQFTAGGISGPSLFHFNNTISNSTPFSLACFDSVSGNYLSGMFNGLLSPAIPIANLPANTSGLRANFQIRGKLDPARDSNYCFPDGYCLPDYFLVEVRGYRNGAWGYWDFVGVNEAFNSIGSFVSYNSVNMHSTSPDFNLLACDSAQYRIYLISNTDKEIVSPAYVYVDDFTLTALFPVGVNDDKKINQPDKYYLSNNYPNPFNPVTQIDYFIPNTGNIKISIFNSLGENVAVLVDDIYSAGNYTVTWDAAELPSGIYYLTLKTGEFFQTRKMLLIK